MLFTLDAAVLDAAYFGCYGLGCFDSQPLCIPVDNPALSLQFAFDFYSFRIYLHHQISHY